MRRDMRGVGVGYLLRGRLACRRPATRLCICRLHHGRPLPPAVTTAGGVTRQRCGYGASAGGKRPQGWWLILLHAPIAWQQRLPLAGGAGGAPTIPALTAA